jgi:ferrous iron transport protein A
MMPLAMLEAGKPGVIKKIGGRAETRKFLENLGFVQGTPITLIAKISGNVIVSVKESRVAISREMARQIMI